MSRQDSNQKNNDYLSLNVEIVFYKVYTFVKYN